MMDKSAPVKPSVARRAGRALIWFFAVMLALAYIALATGDLLKARVTLGRASGGVVDLSLRGSGTWTLSEESFYPCEVPRAIISVFVRAGDAFEAGDPLFSYDMGDDPAGRSVSSGTLSDYAKRVRKAREVVSEAPADTPHRTNAERALRRALFAEAQWTALRNGGIVYAPFGGIATGVELAQGREAVAQTSGITVATDALRFTFALEREDAARIAAGDEVELYGEDGRPIAARLTVASIGGEDAQGERAVYCAGTLESARVGGEQDWKIAKQSPRYACCVPVEALREGGEGWYVLVLTETETVLGAQASVRTEAVDVLSRDETRAAVSASLAESDRIVLTSSKALANGDLVVIADA